MAECAEVIKNLEGLFAGNAEGARALIAKSQERFGEYGEGLLRALQLRMPGHASRNWTDWNYDFCFTYEFACESGVELPHVSHQGLVTSLQQLKRPLLVAHIEVSAVLPFFRFVFWSRWLAKAETVIRSEVLRAPVQARDGLVMERFCAELREQGYEEIGFDILCQAVPNIRYMDLADPDVVCVYNCLFRDIDGGRPVSELGYCVQEAVER
jgi:hypothetical protein